MENHFEDTVPLTIDGVLDLHTFHPSEVKDLIHDYISECLKTGIYDLRIIHGKGTGRLRATVHSLLNRDTRVKAFCTASEDAGGWGATIVALKRQK